MNMATAYPVHMLGAGSGKPQPAPSATASMMTGASASLSAVATSLRLRHKRPADVRTNDTPPVDPAKKSSWKNPFSPPTHKCGQQSEADDGSDPSPSVSSPSLRPRKLRTMLSLPTANARPIHRDASVPDTTALDAISLDAPPHIAMRYGDSIRLYARSKYVSAADGGGYVGTFEAGRRFLASKHPTKQGELACIPPVVSNTALMYRPSTFTVVSTCGIDIGTPVNYGDVVVLVDERGRVWNNKIGVGPTTKNGYFGPREQNAPGEMYLSFYQLKDDGDGASSSESDSDDEDGDSFLSLSSLARTTKTMAETTFGKPTQMEMDLATKALRTVGRVIYYGDKNVIIDVADSNRLRSKFNRVVTHYKKNDELAVRGGYLRCDGRGKAIMFEIHGQPMATVQSIDVCNPADGTDADKDEDGERNGEDDEGPSLCVPLSSGAGVAVERILEIKNVHAKSVVSVLFSDGGQLKIPCSRFVEAGDEPFFRIVRGGDRPLRLQMLATKSTRAPKSVSLKKTLRDTYQELAKVYSGVVIVSSAVAYVLSKLLRLTISLPAMYLGGMTVLAVFFMELFFPGVVLKSHTVHEAEQDANFDNSLGDWNMSILSIEASESERIESSAFTATLSRQRSSVALKIPKSFLMAENGDVTKATERYQATLAWRKESQADTILTTPQTHFSTIKQYYHQFLHKTDKLGHPVYFEKIGSINMKQLQKLGITQDDLFRHYLFAMEFTLKYAANQICPCDACASSQTQKLFLVLDARGIGMKDVTGESAEFIRRCTGIMQRHYPQRSFKIFFVNVPSWFGMVWKGIKPLLNETTRAKTNILSESETSEGLLAHIDAENLPVEYGGTCACPGGCEENSTYQRLQKALVQSVLSCQPFSPEDTLGCERQSSEMGVDSELDEARLINRDSASSTGMTELTTTMVGCRDDDTMVLPSGLFRDDVLRAGYLLKRPMKHNHFTPIWNRRFFILHPDSIRFGKVPRSEIYQIVQLTSSTIVRKTQKGNTTFEVVTPLMATNGHSLVLYASSASSMNKWVDAIQQAIDKLAGKSTNRTSGGEELGVEGNATPRPSETEKRAE